MNTDMQFKIQRIVFYSLIIALISYGLNYHIGKAFIHLATAFSIVNIFLAIKNQSSKGLSLNSSNVIVISLLLTSSALILIYYLKFTNSISEKYFSNMFYPAIIFAVIIPSLRIKKSDINTIFISTVVACIFMASSGIIDYYLSQKTNHRTSGFLNLPIIYASCMVITTCLISSYFFQALSRNKWITAGLLFIAICSGFAAIILTGSRGPILAFVAVFIALLAYHLISIPSKKKSVSALLFLLASIAILASFIPQSKLESVKSRFHSGVSNLSKGFEGTKRPVTSTGIRLDMWEASLVSISDHPLTGIGPGRHTDYFQKLKEEKRTDINTELVVKFSHMHNDFIQAWLSMGIIFGTLSLAFIIYLFYFFLFMSKNKKESMLGASVCFSFLLCGLTDVPAHNAASLTLFLLLISLQLSLVEEQS